MTTTMTTTTDDRPRPTRASLKVYRMWHKHRLQRRWVRRHPGWSHRQIMLHVESHKLCSCLMCGNRRGWEGETRQELRHTLAWSLAG